MLDRTPIPPPRPGRAILARTVEGLRAAAARLSRVVPGQGLMGIESGGGGLQGRRRGRETYMARLSGSGNPYSFTEVSASVYGSWKTFRGGRTGSNAYELNGTTGLGGAVVEITPVAAGAWHRFAWRSRTTTTVGHGLYFLVRMCGRDDTSFTVTITGISPNTYTATQSSTLIEPEGFSVVAFGGQPAGEYNYTITRCNGHVTTGTTIPRQSDYFIDIEPPTGKISGCCGENYWFPATLTVSDATGSTVLTLVPGITPSCCCSQVEYSGQHTVGGFPGQCYNAGTGCTPATVSITISYFVGCTCASGGTVTFSGRRTWQVDPNYAQCGFSPNITAICCYISGGNFNPVTSGGSPSRNANEAPQTCATINCTIDVTDSPFAFEGGGYPRTDCHPVLGNLLTVTE